MPDVAYVKTSRCLNFEHISTNYNRYPLFQNTIQYSVTVALFEGQQRLINELAQLIHCLKLLIIWKSPQINQMQIFFQFTHSLSKHKAFPRHFTIPLKHFCPQRTHSIKKSPEWNGKSPKKWNHAKQTREKDNIALYSLVNRSLHHLFKRWFIFIPTIYKNSKWLAPWFYIKTR